MFMNVGLGGTDTPDKIIEYIKMGAKEFFAGFIPREWLEKYGWEVCPNRRPMGVPYNYAQESLLREVIQTIHEHDCRISLAVNAHDNGSERLSMLHDQFNLFETMQPDAYIIADPGLMFSMQAWGIDRPICLSTGVGCFNSEAVRFFCEQFPVQRVVIPRKLTMREMQQIVTELKDLNLEFEVMIIGYRCFFNDENCHSIHSAQRRNLCGDVISAPFKVSNHMPNNWKEVIEELLKEKAALLCENSILNQFRQNWNLPPPPPTPDWSEKTTRKGMEAEVAKMLYQNCGLCVIKTLRDMGVQVLKVPLRGDEGVKKQIVEMVGKVMNHPSPTRKFCQELINSPDFCSTGLNCYYHVPENASGD